MSKYTSIILFISALENEKERITEVNNFEIEPGKKLNLTDLNDLNKFPDLFPRFTYAGTYNYFNLEIFLNFLSTVKWEYPQYVQLVISEEDAYRCKVYGNAGKKLEIDSIPR